MWSVISVTEWYQWYDVIKVKVKVGFLYSAPYSTTGPARFTISEVAVDWQEPMCCCANCGHPIACVNIQLDPRYAASKHTTALINCTRPSPRKCSPDVTRRRHYCEETNIWLQLTTQFIDLKKMKGWVDLRGWLHTEIKCRLRELNLYMSPIPVLTGLDVE